MIRSRCKSGKSRKHKPPTWKTASLYPHLQASVGADFLDKQDLVSLGQIHKAQKSPAGDHPCITCIQVSRTEKGFKITNLGESYSPEYQKIIVKNAQSSGLGKILLACLKAAQKQGIASLLIEKQGGFPEPRRAASPRWKNLKTRPSQKQWEDLVDGLKFFYQMWPLELLANILNSRSNKQKTTSHAKTNKTRPHHPRHQRRSLRGKPAGA